MKLSKSKSTDGRPLYRAVISGSVAIPGDIHIPFHDPIALSTFIRSTAHCDTLIILGDLFDNYALSAFPKHPELVAKFTIQKEVDIARKWIDKLAMAYPNVMYIPGNHEKRWNVMTAKNPALAGMDWWWPLRDIIPTGWELLDVDSRVEIRRGGHRIWLEHGDRATRNSSFVSADKLTALYPSQVTIVGHNHRLAAHHRTHWINNKDVSSSAYSVGHLSTISKLGYVSAPDWQKGGLVISDRGFQLLNIKGERVTWL